MGRSTPPAAIVAPPPLALANTETQPVSDLPLRNFDVAPEEKTPQTPKMPPTPPDDQMPTPLSLLDTPKADIEPDFPTPSSTIVEFDEGDEFEPPSPAATGPVGIVAENIARSFSRSRSRSGHGDHIREPSRSNTPRPSGRSSRSRSRLESPHRHVRNHSTSESVSRYLRNNAAARSPPLDPTRELIQENTSLHQRIAGLQRSERDLLTENQELNRQLTSLRNLHDTRRKKWREQYRERERVFQARIQELEGRLAQREMELQRHAAQAALRDAEPPVLSDAECVSWFTARSITWQSWADEYAHLDPKRVQSGLHPVQLLELCESVKSFVRITDEGLPDELLYPGGHNGVKATHVLLHAMLANFIITEILSSPYWIFNTIASGGFDIDSPSVVHVDSPIGFRMELALWQSANPPRTSMFPPKTAALPPKTAARLMQESMGPHRAAPGGPTLPALSLNTAGLSGTSGQGLPRRQEMEHLAQLISNVQQNDREVHTFRAHLVRTLSEGGLGLELDKLEGEDRRRLANARRTYAKRLKDRFLGGAARFLMENQGPEGIDKLEAKLTNEFDLALKFSCQIWSRPDSLRVKGLEDLANAVFVRSNDTMDLCPGQAPVITRPQEEAQDAVLPPAYHDGHTVVMAVQPIIQSVILDKQGKEKATRVLSKARVLVAVPQAEKALAAQAASQCTCSAATSPLGAEKSPAIGANPKPTESTAILPGIAFQAPPKPSQSPTKPSPIKTSPVAAQDSPVLPKITYTAA